MHNVFYVENNVIFNIQQMQLMMRMKKNWKMTQVMKGSSQAFPTLHWQSMQNDDFRLKIYQLQDLRIQLSLVF